jgi:hypothetical protein
MAQSLTLWHVLFYRNNHEARMKQVAGTKTVSTGLLKFASSRATVSCNWEAYKKKVAQLVEAFVITYLV